MRRFTIWLLLLVLAGFCADRDLAGRYDGEWKSATSGNSGALHMIFEATPDAAWKCEARFSIDGEDVKTTVRDCKLQDSKLDAKWDFEVQGATLRSHLTGTWTDGAFKGQYETSVVGGDAVDAGAWSASRAK